MYVNTHTFDLFVTPTTRTCSYRVSSRIHTPKIHSMLYAIHTLCCYCAVLCCVVLVDTLIILYNERCTIVCEPQHSRIHTHTHMIHIRLRYTFQSSIHNESVIRKQSIGNDIYVRRSRCCCSITIRGVISHTENFKTILIL